MKPIRQRKSLIAQAKMILGFTLGLPFLLMGAIQGRVVFEDGSPGAYLTVEVPNHKKAVITDSQGNFSMDLPPGEYAILVGPYEYTVRFQKDQPVKITIPVFGMEIRVEPTISQREAIKIEEINLPGGSSIAEKLVFHPSIALSGLGGATQTVNVQGFSKQRVRVEVEGYRLRVERRAGVDLATFIPDLIKEADLFTQGAGTSHGSEAFGGVVDFHLFGKTSSPKRKFTFFGSSNQESRGITMDWGGEGWRIHAGWEKGESYKDARGRVAPSGFSRVNLFGTFSTSSGQLDLFLTEGWDIEKPYLSSHPTRYPLKRLDILGYRGKKGHWRYQLGVIHQDLVTQSKGAYSRLKSTNLHLKAYGVWNHWGFGIDGYLRPYIYSENRGDEKSFPLEGAKSGEIAPWVSYTWGDFSSSIRMNTLTTEKGDQSYLDIFPTFMVRWQSQSPTYDLTFTFFNSFRFPSVEELFYEGLTARGYIQGNPDLSSERGLGGAWELKRRFSFGTLSFSVTYQRVSDYIEKIKIQPGLYTYENHGETDVFFSSLGFSWSYGSLYLSGGWGEGKEGFIPDDLAPLKLLLHLAYPFQNWKPYISMLYQFSRDRVGINEMPRDDLLLLQGGISYAGSQTLWEVGVENLTDQGGFLSFDEKALPIPGRTFFAKLSWYFP